MKAHTSSKQTQSTGLQVCLTDSQLVVQPLTLTWQYVSTNWLHHTLSPSQADRVARTLATHRENLNVSDLYNFKHTNHSVQSETTNSTYFQKNDK